MLGIKKSKCEGCFVSVPQTTVTTEGEFTTLKYRTRNAMVVMMMTMTMRTTTTMEVVITSYLNTAMLQKGRSYFLECKSRPLLKLFQIFGLDSL